MHRYNCFKLLIFVFILISNPLFIHGQPLGDKPPLNYLRIGIYDNPPKLFIDENNQAKGIFPGLINAIAQKEGWKIKFIPLSFKEGLARLEKGEIDIMQDVAWSQKRSQTYKFTNETVMVSWGRVYKSQTANISTLIDLNNKRIAHMDGGIYSEGPNGLKALMKKFELNATFIPANGYKQVFEFIDQGKADAGVVNRLYGKTNKHKYPIDNTPILISPISIRLAFNKSNPVTPQLIKIIDTYLIQFKKNENSIYYQLIDEYIREPRKILPKFFKPLLFILFLLLTFFVMLGIFFRKQSKTKSHQLKKRDRELKESEKKFRTIFENLQDVYFDINLSGIIHTISPSAKAILGFSPDKLIHQPIHKIFDNPNEAKTFLEQLITKNSVRDFQFLCRNSTAQWASINADLYQDIDGTPKGIRGVLRDITPQKNTEEILIKNEERFREMARLLPCGIVEADIQMNITYANQTGLDMFGYTQADIEKGINGKDLIHPEEKNIPGQRIKKIQANEPLAPVELQMIKKDGRFINVLWNSTPIISDNKICGVRGSIVDLTEIKQLQEHILRTQKLESTGILAGGIAHDFNNILLGLFGNISLAKDELSEKDSAYQLLEDSEKSLSRAKDLTTQLLTFAQGGEPIKQAITIDQIIKETANFNLTGSNIKIVMDKPEGLWRINADKGQISQVISNLVINARQAMPDGGRIIINLENAAVSENEFSSLTLGKYVKISLSDEGNGIPETDLEKIFDPYFTTKQDGSGLGLSIVHSIILKHLGYIYVNSELNEGTTFVIYLPAANSRADTKKKSENPEFIETKDRTLNILLMDDDPLVRDVSKKILTKLGHHADLCNDGTHAIENYQKAMNKNTPYDLVIMDLTIPGGMGGMGAIEQLLAIDPKIRGIVASGYSTDPILAHYTDHGFKAMITKPYTVEKMRQVIDKALRS